LPKLGIIKVDYVAVCTWYSDTESDASVHLMLKKNWIIFSMKPIL